MDTTNLTNTPTTASGSPAGDSRGWVGAALEDVVVGGAVLEPTLTLHGWKCAIRPVGAFRVAITQITVDMWGCSVLV